MTEWMIKKVQRGFMSANVFVYTNMSALLLISNTNTYTKRISILKEKFGRKKNQIYWILLQFTPKLSEIDLYYRIRLHCKI